MNLQARLSVVIFYLMLMAPVSVLHGSERNKCSVILSELVSKFHLALADPTKDYTYPYVFLRQSYGDGYLLRDDNSVHIFDTEILAIYEEPHDNRSQKWLALKEKYKLSDEELAQVEAYYSLMVFDGDPSLLGAKKDLLKTVRRLSLHHILETNPEYRERYEYYLKNLGSKSVPEMAVELKKTQGAVYKELSFFNLSILDSFEGDYGAGETQASRFVRHYLNLSTRGVAWDRMTGGQREDLLLVQMRDLGMTHAEMADSLNKLFSVTKPDDMALRTEGSVSGKLKALGLTTLNPRELNDLSIEPYGAVKVAGVLIPASAAEFVFDHRDKGLDWCALQLGISRPGLKNFLERQHILHLFEEKGGDRSVKTRSRKKPNLDFLDEVNKRNSGRPNRLNFDALELSEKRTLLHDQVIDFALANEAKLPVDKQWDEVLQVSLTRYFGTGYYVKDSGRTSKARLHDSRKHAYEGLLARATERRDAALQAESGEVVKQLDAVIDNINEWLIGFKFEALPVNEKRTVLHDRVIDFALENQGQLPVNKQWDEVLKVKLSRFFGTGPNLIYDSRENAYEGLLARATERRGAAVLAKNGEVVKKLDAVIDNINEWLIGFKFEALPVNEKRTVLHDRVIDFALENQTKLPADRQWDKVLQIGQGRYFGTGRNAKDKGRFAKYRLHDSTKEAYDGLLARATERRDAALQAEGGEVVKQLDAVIENINEWMNGFKFEALPLNEKRTVLHDRVIDFALEHEATLPAYKGWDEALQIGQGRYFGTGEYAKDRGSDSASRLHDSTKDTYDGLLARVNERRDAALKSQGIEAAKDLDALIKNIESKKRSLGLE